MGTVESTFYDRSPTTFRLQAGKNSTQNPRRSIALPLLSRHTNTQKSQQILLTVWRNLNPNLKVHFGLRVVVHFFVSHSDSHCDHIKNQPEALRAILAGSNFPPGGVGVIIDPENCPFLPLAHKADNRVVRRRKIFAALPHTNFVDNDCV